MKVVSVGWASLTGFEKMNLIVAVDKNWAIGKDNKLLVSIPQDMKFFRETTTGKVVVNFHGGNNFLFGNVSFWLEYLPVGKVPEEHQWPEADLG